LLFKLTRKNNVLEQVVNERHDQILSNHLIENTSIDTVYNWYNT